MFCDMCGQEGNLFKVSIEDSELNLCRNCSRFGKIIAPIKAEQPVKKVKKETIPKEPEKEIIQIIVEDYADRIRNAREKMGLKQEDFAKLINEKQNLIHNIEIGKFKPGIDLAKKLERFLKIKLVEEYEEQHKKIKKPKGDKFTIGDFLNKK